MERNKALRRRLQVAEGEWVRLLAERRAMDRLYGPIPYAQWTLVPARVVAADALPYGRRRLVNAGRTDGAEAGSAVTTRRLLTDRSKRLPSNVAAIAAQTLAGRIINAGPFTATLQLVTDPDFAVAAKILRVIDPNDPRTITVTAGDASRQILSNRNNYPVPVLARGAGEGGLVVEDVSVHHNIQRGDRLVTAGDNAFLPVRVEIGVVREVINDPEQRGLYQTLRVTPSASLEALRQVFLVVPAGEASVGGGE